MNEPMFISQKRNQVTPLWMWASYLMDVNAGSTKTPYPLEIVMSKGVYHLNSLHANQSNGSLKLAFHHVFHRLGIYGQSLDKVLVLGLGLGSVIDLLQNQCSMQHITAYENNPTILEWLNQYYEIKDIDIIDQSAENIVSGNQYQLIIIDLFIDDEIPEFLMEKAWWETISSSLSTNSILLWNTLAINRISSDIQKIFDTNISILDNRFYVKRQAAKTV